MLPLREAVCWIVRYDPVTRARDGSDRLAARLTQAECRAIPINIADHVGRTPMVQLTRIAPEGAELFAKLEMFNPGGRSRTGSASR